MNYAQFVAVPLKTGFKGFEPQAYCRADLIERNRKTTKIVRLS